MFRQLTTHWIATIAILLCAAGHNAYADHGDRTHGNVRDDHQYSPSLLNLYYGSGYVYYGSGYYADSSRSRYGYDDGSLYAVSAPGGGCGSQPYCYDGTDSPVPRASSGYGGGSTAGSAPPRPELDYRRYAEEAFQAGRYDQALRLGNHALVETPRNGKLHLFVSLVLFTTGDYPRAAAAIHEGTSLLEPKDWGYAVKNYPGYYGSEVYTKQMGRLEKFLEENPGTAYARLVRGYYLGFLGHKEAARRDLAKVVELESRDRLAARLLEMFGGKTGPAPAKPKDDVADFPKAVAQAVPEAVAEGKSSPEAVGDMHAHDEHGHH